VRAEQGIYSRGNEKGAGFSGEPVTGKVLQKVKVGGEGWKERGTMKGSASKIRKLEREEKGACRDRGTEGSQQTAPEARISVRGRKI